MRSLRGIPSSCKGKRRDPHRSDWFPEPLLLYERIVLQPEYHVQREFALHIAKESTLLHTLREEKHKEYEGPACQTQFFAALQELWS